MVRKLEELNLLDDFLFGSMLTYPEIGEEFVRELLKAIFGREFGKLTVVPQKVYYGSNTDKHGARLDVYLEEELPGEASVAYDVEPDKNDDSESVAALPKRVRFYHAKIDARSLRSGEKYQALKNVVVIMITPFDPFGRDHMVYTIRSMCEEIPDMPYDDGARTIFLYTKGKLGDPNEELRQFLQYMEDTKKENAKNEALLRVHRMVETVKQDEEVSLEYMKIFEREEMLVKQGIKLGIEQGMEQGIKLGMEQGREQEQLHTERERRRADAAEKEVERLKQKIERMNRN